MGGPIFHIASRTSACVSVCVQLLRLCFCDAHTHSDCSGPVSLLLYSPVASATAGSVMWRFACGGVEGWGC